MVNNAGFAEFGIIESCSVKSWRRVMKTNMDGIFYLLHALVPHLKNQKAVLLILPQFLVCARLPNPSPMVRRSLP